MQNNKIILLLLVIFYSCSNKDTLALKGSNHIEAKAFEIDYKKSEIILIEKEGNNYELSDTITLVKFKNGYLKNFLYDEEFCGIVKDSIIVLSKSNLPKLNKYTCLDGQHIHYILSLNDNYFVSVESIYGRRMATYKIFYGEDYNIYRIEKIVNNKKLIFKSSQYKGPSKIPHSKFIEQIRQDSLKYLYERKILY